MSRLGYFLESANAVSEEDLGVIFEKIMNPIENAEEMGKIFTQSIGYNPITFYTEKAASDVFFYIEEMIRDDYPKTFAAIADAEDKITKDLIARNEETREQYAYFGIKGKIRNIMKNTNEMNKEKNSEIENYSNILKKGYQLLEDGNNQYENMKIDNQKMSIMLFTSGTTNLPKAVMLSQENICANISAIATWVKLYETDTLLSFLPIHHTFECTITFLYGLYWGTTIAFCDGLKYIQQLPFAMD